MKVSIHNSEIVQLVNLHSEYYYVKIKAL